MRDRLRNMQLRMMGFDAVTGRATPQRAQRETSPAQVIVALRAALVVERKARIAAEARLREVLAEVERRLAQSQPPPSAVETAQLPAASATVDVTPDVIDGEVVEVDSVSDAIAALGGDEGNEDDNG